jgi:hypothetical protein
MGQTLWYSRYTWYLDHELEEEPAALKGRLPGGVPAERELESQLLMHQLSSASQIT